MGDLTERGNKARQKIYDFLIDFFMQNGYAPSVREIAAAVGLKSTSTIFSHLAKLEREGKIEIRDKSPRAIRLVGYKFVKEEEGTTTQEETEEAEDE